MPPCCACLALLAHGGTVTERMCLCAARVLEVHALRSHVRVLLGIYYIYVYNTHTHKRTHKYIIYIYLYIHIYNIYIYAWSMVA